MAHARDVHANLMKATPPPQTRGREAVSTARLKRQDEYALNLISHRLKILLFKRILNDVLLHTFLFFYPSDSSFRERMQSGGYW